MKYLHVVHFHSTVLDVVFFTYESNTMYLQTIKVHSNIDVTKVEISCVIDEVFARCSLSLYSTRCRLLTLMKAIRCICRH